MRNIIKNILIILLTSSMLFVLTGCGKKEQDTTVNQKPIETDQVVELSGKEISLGEWKENKYNNEFLGIKLNLPEEWTYKSVEEIKKTNKQRFNKNNLDYIYASEPNTINTINIFSEKTELDIDEKSYINQFITNLSEMSSDKNEISEIKEEEISGIRCYTLQKTINISDVEITQKYYIYKIDDNIINIIIRSLDGEEGIEKIVKYFE